MAKTVVITQSNYIPWKGYFDLINLVDEFILYDDRQFTRRDWRSRNRIKTAQGATWLTIPVAVKGRYHQRIDETAGDGLHRALRHFIAAQDADQRFGCRSLVTALFRHWHAYALSVP